MNAAPSKPVKKMRLQRKHFYLIALTLVLFLGLYQLAHSGMFDKKVTDIKKGMTQRKVRQTWGPPDSVSGDRGRRHSTITWTYTDAFKQYKVSFVDGEVTGTSERDFRPPIKEQ